MGKNQYYKLSEPKRASAEIVLIFDRTKANYDEQKIRDAIKKATDESQLTLFVGKTKGGLTRSIISIRGDWPISYGSSLSYGKWSSGINDCAKAAKKAATAVKGTSIISCKIIFIDCDTGKKTPITVH
ncbi:hypothetical protein IK110_03995 [Candidatus Saccharibacteria bacterium]|nr:hypothetical protein [Candidatus Saccharibacteria bacterium]